MERYGIPGIVPEEQDMAPEMAAMLLQRTEQTPTITDRDVERGIDLLTKYKDGKSNLENRIVNDELWWELRHWEGIGQSKAKRVDKSGKEVTSTPPEPKPSSAWLFNTIQNKHADAMDNYPEPVVLPRERSDEQSAKTLSQILPVVQEYNHFEQVYSDNWWEKLKHGTAVYGIFWDPQKDNGLGDIEIRDIDLLKLFWEPGITDIQKSRNLFIVDLVDNDLLDSEYPQLKGKQKGKVVDVKEYIYDDNVDTSDKSVVVDWYYKVKTPDGRTALHYIKFVGSTLLYASENDPEYRERGFYDHGMYPVVLDVMYPEKGTPIGFGYVAICKDPQLYIDKLSANILENAMMATKKRFFVSDTTAINEQEFLDWNRPLVHVNGPLDDGRIQEIVTQPLSDIYVTVAQMKIEEMKDTAANRDVNSGGTTNVTAAAAIAALQEAGNKASRDMIAASYRAYTQINTLCVELMRQFYDLSRSFRITGEGSEYQFIDFDNTGLQDQVTGLDTMGNPMYRRPVFDLKIKAQKKNPFSRMEQNERAKELYAMGFFAPENAQASLIALDMMDFEGIQTVKEKVMQGQTLLNMVMQMSQQLAAITGVLMPQEETQSGGGTNAAESGGGGGDGLASGVMEAQTPMTGYGQALAKRSTPSV
uniref:Portal protein n=1 Tax=Siphoviridae sp. ctdau33 TaxID=2827902 RepID=A0A8S5S688_9CAUD|nr:MAG TPA: portal protein [Siphoviridae sp. ctdau33]DAG21984.1 MAG TPA: portal protein [Bacteriophage sp.]